MSASRAQKFAIILSLAAAALFVAGVRGDDLDRFKAENEVKAQKLTADVKAALTQSRTLERSDPVKARDMLRKVQGRLEDDLTLPESERSAFQEQVRARLKAVIQAVRERQAEEEAAARKAEARQKEIQRREAERQAQKERSPSSVAKDYYNSGRAQLEAAQRLKLQREKGRLGALADIDQSMTDGINGEQRITKRFVWATEQRKKKLSAKEIALLKAMNSVLTVPFEKTPFREAIDYLQEKTGLTIILDDASLRDAMVEKDDPVDFPKRKVQVRTILRKILADKGLTYVIVEGALQVVTPQKARDFMVVRTYPVGDLVNPIQGGGPFVNWVWSQQNAQMLIDQIKSSVDPSIWEQGATISYNPSLRALLIRAPAEVHYQLGFGEGYGRK
jgi:hypothetical protein